MRKMERYCDVCLQRKPNMMALRAQDDDTMHIADVCPPCAEKLFNHHAKTPGFTLPMLVQEILSDHTSAVEEDDENELLE